MLWKLNIPFEYMLDGDIADITDEILNRYFTGDAMQRPCPATSCATKHLLIYQEMVRRNIAEALILEDDIILRNDFVCTFNQSIDEVHHYAATHPGPIMISYEDTRLRFVPRSQRRDDTVIYPGDRDRMTGAYYCNIAAAQLVLDYALTHKLDQPIDLTHCHLLRSQQLVYFWCQPTIATQGSHLGLFSSAINLHKSMLSPLKWKAKLAYRKLLYWLR